MYLRLKTAILLLIIPVYFFSQSNDILFTINNKKFTKSEFIDYYNKNNSYNISENRDSTRKYLNYFVNYKLNITDAEANGFDKNESFTKKLDDYKEQITLPYIIDKELINKYAREAFERMKTEVHVRQILIKINAYADPKDTVVAYQKALRIIKRISSGEDFASVAMQVSDDPSAAYNGGDLWYIGPFKLPYSIENYVYSNNSKKISNPIRTKSGYHIIEILDKRNNPGSFKVAHILLPVPDEKNEAAETKAKLLADSIYVLANSGQDFAKLAMKFSGDKGSAANGGELPWFETGTMPHEFETTAYGLTFDGQIAAPVLSRFGWHIIKRISQKSAPAYSQIEDQLINNVLKSDRVEDQIQKIYDKLKAEFHYSDYGTLPTLIENVDSTIFTGEWKIPELVDLSATLFSVDNQNYTIEQFAKYLYDTQKFTFPIPIGNYVYSVFDHYVKNELLQLKEKSLLKNDKTYSNLINKYRDEMLYLGIMQKEVWNKINDNEAFTEFYNKNKDSYNNFYQGDISVFEYGTDQTDKLTKQFKKLKENNISDSLIASKINESLDNQFELVHLKKNAKTLLLKSCYSKINAGSVDPNEKLLLLSEEKRLIWINSEITKSEISDSEAISLARDDYQKQIEESRILSLKKNYRIDINESVFESIFTN